MDCRIKNSVKGNVMMKLDPIVEGERESEQDGVFDGELTKAVTTESILESLPVEMEDDESTPIE